MAGTSTLNPFSSNTRSAAGPFRKSRNASASVFDTAVAAGLLDRLKVARLLDGPRGRPKLARAALSETVARFSQLLASLGPALAEVDINPLIVHEKGVVAVDALIVPSQGSHR